MILRAEHVTKRFAGVTALQDVSFSLRAGEIHALCGENGAGKSTLIKLLSGVHRHGSYSGRIVLGDTEARFRSVRDATAAGISVIHQELSFIDELSVADNIMLGHERVRWGLWLDRRRAEREAGDVLARFGVSIDPSAPMRSLGVGHKQLVEIAKALARDARILILDEPTAALADHEVQRLLGILADLRARGIACIYISHRLEEVSRIADQVTVLRDGRTVGSLQAAEADGNTIVRHMVGREITQLYRHTERTPGEPVLSVRNLDVADADGQPRLHDLSFELRAGEVLGIGGLMGAGRTELLMHLYGAWGTRRSGSVRLCGRPLQGGGPRAALRAGMALVTEDRRRFGLHLEESVGFNLSLSSLAGVSRGGLIRRGAEARRNGEWMSSLRIKAPEPSSIVGRLSGGNQQKVVLGRALMSLPRVVLLDEPTRGVDIGAKLEIYALIERLAGEGCAVLLVSSEMPELIGVSDRILMLCDGRVGGQFQRDEATPERLLQAALGGGVRRAG